MQYLLHFLGFDRSYLFLNSFVYPIFGQYTPDLRPLAQDPRSPIVIHRNQIFDKAVIEGDVRLVIAVGRAAKESVATWIEAHGGTAQPESLHTASLGIAAGRVRVVGVLHPGSAASGSTAAIKADFLRAIGHVRDWLQADPGWLPADPGVTAGSRGAVSLRLAGDPVPGLPVRHLPASGPRRDVEQPQRWPAGDPPVLRGGEVQRARRAPQRPLVGGWQRRGLRRRSRRPAL